MSYKKLGRCVTFTWKPKNVIFVLSKINIFSNRLLFKWWQSKCCYTTTQSCATSNLRLSFKHTCCSPKPIYYLMLTATETSISSLTVSWLKKVSRKVKQFHPLDCWKSLSVINKPWPCSKDKQYSRTQRGFWLRHTDRQNRESSLCPHSTDVVSYQGPRI